MPRRTPFLSTTLRLTAALTSLVALTGCAEGTAGVRAARGPIAPKAADAGPFYVDPDSNPAAWVREHPGDARAARIRDAIAERPMARWFGNWSGGIDGAVSAYVTKAQQAQRTPILVAYNITDRDCSGESSGGAGSPAKYRAWIDGFVAGVGTHDAVVVVEPDAVAQLDCLPADARTARLDLLKYAAGKFKAGAPNAKVYLDGGNSEWIAPATMADRLNSAGLADVHGFSVNVSNFFSTGPSAVYGKQLSAALSEKHGYTRPFIVDTARNGAGGKAGDWCNPSTARLGTPSQAGGSEGAEMLLWLKVPGDSDGSCGSGEGVPAGQFSPDLAIGLVGG